MLKPVKVIPCFVLENKRIVNKNLSHEFKISSDPLQAARTLSEQGASELVFIDIDAPRERMEIWARILKQIKENVTVPVTFGNNMNTVDDFEQLLFTGVDRIAIDVIANTDPALIDILGRNHGSQRVLPVISGRKNQPGTGRHRYEIIQRRTRESTGIDLVEWAKMAQMLGASSIMIHCLDAEGTMQGYDLELLSAVTSAVSVPVIASGGAGELEHFYQAVSQSGVSGLAASTIFTSGKATPGQVKEYLQKNNIKVDSTSKVP